MAATSTHYGSQYFDGTVVFNTTVTLPNGNITNVMIAAGTGINQSKIEGVKTSVDAIAADALVMTLTNRYIAKTTGGDAEALTLADGVAGQLLTISIVVDGGGTGTLTPDTMSGFATIILADAGDTVTLQYVDDSVGWIIVGMTGVAAPPVITI